MSRNVVWISSIVFFGLAGVASSTGGQNQLETKFNARAVNMGGGPTGATTNLQISITKWTSAGQRRWLLGILEEKGHDAVIDALREMGQAGHARALGVAAGRANPFPSTPFQAAYEVERGEEREVIMLGERPIGGREAASNTSSVDYDITVIIMQFPANDAEAKGTGLLYRALKIRWDEENDKLVVEQMGREPIRLTEITKIQ